MARFNCFKYRGQDARLPEHYQVLEYYRGARSPRERAPLDIYTEWYDMNVCYVFSFIRECTYFSAHEVRQKKEHQHMQRSHLSGGAPP